MTYRDIMKQNERIERWKAEEREAHIRGWDFSHIEGRYDDELDKLESVNDAKERSIKLSELQNNLEKYYFLHRIL